MAVVFAVVGSLGILSNFLSLLPFLWRGFVIVGILAAFAVPIVLFARMVENRFEKLIDMHEGNTRKMIALENHRSKYGSLPDDLTFEMIVRLKPDELVKKLEKPHLHRPDDSVPTGSTSHPLGDGSWIAITKRLRR